MVGTNALRSTHRGAQNDILHLGPADSRHCDRQEPNGDRTELALPRSDSAADQQLHLGSPAVRRTAVPAAPDAPFGARAGRGVDRCPACVSCVSDGTSGTVRRRASCDVIGHSNVATAENVDEHASTPTRRSPHRSPRASATKGVTFQWDRQIPIEWDSNRWFKPQSLCCIRITSVHPTTGR